MNYDTTNMQSWFSQNLVYDTSNILQKQSVTYDDFHTILNDYDSNNSQTWSTHTLAYVTINRLDIQADIYPTYTTDDQAFNPAHQLINHYHILNDGTIVYV